MDDTAPFADHPQRLVLLIASGGGRVSELLQLRERMTGFDEYVWAVPDTAQTRSTLDGSRVHFLSDQVRPRSVRGIMAASPAARRLLKVLRPSAVVSTGGSACLPFLIEAARRKIPAHFIESVTYRVEPSVSGRVLSKVPGVVCHTQSAENRWPGWFTVGSPFDIYRSEPVAPSPVRKVVVTLGTVPDHGFRALVERSLELLPTDIDVLWQTGSTDTRDLRIDSRAFMKTNVLLGAVDEADLVIGHAGVGTALDAFAAGKMPVLVPRRAHRNEHIDDHQVQIAGWLARSGLAVGAEVDELTAEHLQRATEHRIVVAGAHPDLRLHGGALEVS